MIEGKLSRKELGFQDNKSVPIEKVFAIDIKKFRTFENQTIFLGDHITVFSGRNGTMKTSLLGLVAHPFEGDGKDAFGKTLKTSLSEVFNLSAEFDKDKYEYDLVLNTTDGLLSEPVSIYYVAEKTNRHRVVVSGAEKGDGNFTYNTSFLNLKRLYPLVDTKASLYSTPTLSKDEVKNLKSFFEAVLPSTNYGNFAAIHHKNLKTTFAPHGDDAVYGWNSISSGEDNLGAIFNRLLGFQRAYKEGQKTGNGILCIDEFDSSLHPVAQLRLFKYLYRWSIRYKVQVVISTHSLYLIQHLYLTHQANLDANRIIINFISKSTSVKGNHPVIKNPPYQLAYKELTLVEPDEIATAKKIKVFCEDEVAIHFAKRLIKSQKILSLVQFHSSLNPTSDNPGTSYGALKSICINYPLLLEHSLVIFDGDVKKEVTAKIKNKFSFLVLPDPNGLALERRVIYYIMCLENADPFFQKFKERDAFLDEFSLANISLTPAEVLDEKIVSINRCKNWVESNPVAFKKYVTYYCNTLLIQNQNQFATEFLNKLNKINVERGFPTIVL